MKPRYGGNERKKQLVTIMRPIFLILLCVFVVPAAAETLRVCTSGTMEDGTSCEKDLQKALHAAQNGDTIVLKSGDTFVGNFQLPGGKSDITIKSSRSDEWPVGYRVERTSPIFARITTSNGNPPFTVGEQSITVTVSPGSPRATLSNAQSLQVGDSIAFVGTPFSPFYCVGVNNPISTCTEERVGKFGFRGSMSIANGDIMYAHAATMPQPLQPNVPYYVVNAQTTDRGGNAANPDMWQISLTPDGPPIQLTDWPSQNGLTLVTSPWPAYNNEPLYITEKNGPNVTLSKTPGGEPITWQSRGNYYTGGSPLRTAGAKVYINRPARNITFQGLEITENAVADPFFLVYLVESGHPDGEHDGITFQHCWIHGDDDATAQPHQGILANARNLIVRDSIIEHIHSDYADTQAIGTSNSSGGILIENNFLSSTGETVMLGGSYPTMFPNLLTGVSIRRNYFTKPKRWWHNIGFSRVDGASVRIKRQYSSLNCDAEANGPSYNQCFWFDADDVRHVITEDSTITFAALPRTGKLLVYGTPSGVKGVHNLKDAIVNCPHFIECSYDPAPAYPRLSTPLGSITIGNSAVSAQGSHIWVIKNQLEVKFGKTVTLEGNIFEFAPAAAQDSILVFNAAPASGDTESINYNAQSIDFLIQNNIFRYGERGLSSSGNSYSNSRPEAAGYGRSARGLLRNNLFYSIGGDDWGNASGEGVHIPTGNSTDYTLDHNTAIDVSHVTRMAHTNYNLAYTNNIFIPWLGSKYTPSTMGDSSVDWFQLVKTGRVVDGKFSRNMLMNRNSIRNWTQRGVHYPDDTYLIDPNDLGRDPSQLFVNWVEKDYNASNYRVKPEAASLYPSTDGRTIGADIDELEAVTGHNGAEIIRGVPTFAERGLRLIEEGSPVVTMSYLKDSPPCTIRIWESNTYVGTPKIDISDAEAEIGGDRRIMRFTNLEEGRTYYGKRSCGVGVDVFSFEAAGPPKGISIQAESFPRAIFAFIEYGETSTLGFARPAVRCQSGCTLAVPGDAKFYRVVYRNGVGAIIGRADTVQTLGQ
jgi:hypothetical protein